MQIFRPAGLIRPARLTARAALAATLVVTGCSVTVSSGSGISKTKVAQGISDALLKQTGQRPSKTTCPNDLHAKVGVTERCTITNGNGSKIGVTVAVSSVKGKTEQYDIKVDQTVTPAPIPTSS